MFLMLLISAALCVKSHALDWAFWRSGTDMSVFRETTPVNKPYKDLKAKYGNSLYPDDCSEATKEGCKAKFKKDCICYQLPLSRSMAVSRTGYFTVADDVVVQYQDSVGTSPQYIESVLPKVEEFAKNVPPTKVFKSKPAGRFEQFILFWSADGLEAATTAICPAHQYRQDSKTVLKLRSCFSFNENTSRVRDLLKGVDQTKEVKFEY